jgi:beta-phosphoglucomutase family hydrolase
MNDFSSRAFIFDMDGTLIDNMRYHTDAWRTLLEENGFDFNERKFMVETAGQTNREILPGIFGELTEARLGQLAKRKEELYREEYLPHRKPLGGLVDFLEASKKLGVKLAVSTAASPPNMEFILDGLDLRKYFSVVTTAADVKKGKPDPETFLISAKHLGVEPKNSIVFEDAFGGFEAARRAGMTVVGLTTVNSAADIFKCGKVAEAHSNFTTLIPRDLVEKYIPFEYCSAGS